MDNLFLVRDTLDICKLVDAEVGLIALDQEKAFDRVDLNYLFNLLGVLGLVKVYQMDTTVIYWSFLYG